MSITVVIFIVNGVAPNGSKSEFERIREENPQLESCTVDGKQVLYCDTISPRIVVCKRYDDIVFPVCENDTEALVSGWGARFVGSIKYILENTVGLNHGDHVALVPHWGITLGCSSIEERRCTEVMIRCLSNDFYFKLISHSYNWSEVFQGEREKIELGHLVEFLDDAKKCGV